ncbi:MAG TPA: TIGR04372 family glycosyltransferase [Burkholderiales bacterium]|nr:TIGR04372 family glycosyltransferase [Burkholderiales bacterium]
MLPIELILSVPLYLARVRFLRIAIGRIGHLALEPDVFVKEQLLGLTKRCFGVIVSPPGTAANECLLEYWRRYIRVVSYPFRALILARFYRFPYLRYDLNRSVVAINKTAPFIAVQQAWGNRPALLSLEENHRRKGRARLAELGVPSDAEFICFHCREGGYSPSDEHLHSFRNNSIENYLPAASELAIRGLWCIRMGDPTMRRIAPMERVIDYAHLDIRSDWMDVFLCAGCRFFLGSASGLSHVASIFGRPSAMANQVPLSTALQFGMSDVAIPKLLWLEREGRYLNFGEAFDSDISNFRYTNLYQEHGIRLLENTAEDIRNLALEMLSRSEGRAIYTPEDEELQQRFKAHMRPGHYSFGGINRIGRDFLRKYAYLLEERSG